MHDQDEYKLLVDRILATAIDKNDPQFRAAVHEFLREAAERGITASELLGQVDSGVRFQPLIELIQTRLFGAGAGRGRRSHSAP